MPEDIVKVAVLCSMSPLREVPADLHLLGAQQVGKLRVTDPLKSFLRVVEKHLRWRLHWHTDTDALVAKLRATEYPPYFFCVKDRHMLPLEVLCTVAEQGGYLYEGLPSDALGLFRQMTTTQAWTVACTATQVEEATAELQKQWKLVGLREEPHAPPEIIKPKAREDDIGGGFGATGIDSPDDKDWADIDSGDESSDEDVKDIKGIKGAKEVKDVTEAAMEMKAPEKGGSNVPTRGTSGSSSG